MRIEEMHAHYGTWTEVAHELRIGMNAYQYWRKIGYIPYPTQLLIERRSNGLFKAREEDAKPRKDNESPG